jgi:hypothetical protein
LIAAMTLKSPPKLLAALAAVGLIAACTSGSGPGPVEEEYALASVVEVVQSSPLPYRFLNETWIADTIRFHDGGEWSRVQVVTLHGEGTTAEPVRRTSEGFVRLDGGKIVLDFDCNDVILRSCVAPDTVHQSGNRLLRKPNQYGVGNLAYPLLSYEPVVR